MKNWLICIGIVLFASGCWPTSISFKDKAMPEEWKQFSIQTLDYNAANAPISYPANLTEALKDGVQNNTRLKLASSANSGEVQIEGALNGYSIQPIALQPGDVAAKNRLTVTVSFTIFISAPKEEEMKLTSTRFADYDSNLDFSTVETQLLEEINQQIVQDLINKLFSNW